MMVQKVPPKNMYEVMEIHTDPQAGIGFSECPERTESVLLTTTTWVNKI